MNTTDILKALSPAEMDAGIVFSGSPGGTKVMGYDKPSPFTPKINLNYIFHETSRDVIAWLIAPPSPLYVCGVSGVGKSTCITQLAAMLVPGGRHTPNDSHYVTVSKLQNLTHTNLPAWGTGYEDICKT